MLMLSSGVRNRTFDSALCRRALRKWQETSTRRRGTPREDQQGFGDVGTGPFCKIASLIPDDHATSIPAEPAGGDHATPRLCVDIPSPRL